MKNFIPIILILLRLTTLVQGCSIDNSDDDFITGKTFLKYIIAVHRVKGVFEIERTSLNQGEVQAYGVYIPDDPEEELQGPKVSVIMADLATPLSFTLR